MITYEEYENALSIIANLIEDYEIKYPLDVFELCDRMGIKTIQYSTYNDHIDLLLKNSKDGFYLYNKCNNSFIIYYNEKILPIERIKFTIAHEIGHIVLPTKNEQLANFFAGYLLAPAVLIVNYNLLNEEIIVKKFKVSQKCAHYCLKRAIFRLARNNDYLESEKFIINSQKNLIA